jgi:hypothetical protein
VGDFSGDGKPDYVLSNGRQTQIWYMNNNIVRDRGPGPNLPLLPFPFRIAGAADFDCSRRLEVRGIRQCFSLLAFAVCQLI